ncbi:MAG: DEAD/DEAH box helicase family protein [Anaerolineales bacterium]|nr:DEAD/DEAH box helicase family protein [Anaerolineales bacterium]
MLYTTLDALKTAFGWDYFTAQLDEEVVSNLNPGLILREYQKEALGRLQFYFHGYQGRERPTQLLFEMATGSGKTLLMAASILLLYKLGYRNFIFFVNSTNIINKTKDNFLNKSSSKYLFAHELKIDRQVIQIKEVENFETSNDEDIHIAFSTIQGLHSRLNSPRENSITFQDLEEKKIVLISDEAHHINALTKSKLNKTEQEEKQSWEGTVERLFNTNRDNVLLEFTATIDLDHPAVKQKYEKRIIYQYDLKHFRLDKYSKDIEVLAVDLEALDRAIQAVIISQYRRKVAEKHGIPLKPVILFKSKTIVESSEFRTAFTHKIRSLQASDIQALQSAQGELLQTAFAYFANNVISPEALVKELQNDFDENKCLSVDSEQDQKEHQILVNTLEAANNEIRAIFAVNMLNEGWDVLNLFDIVRLYDTRDAKRNQPGPTTISEAQLIGRGARYFPFALDAHQEPDKRKFDDDIENELRVLEQLHYHSAHNPKYIQELKTALTQIGILQENYVQFEFRVKDEFRNSQSWKHGVVFSNNRIENPREAIKGLADAQVTTHHEYQLRTGETTEETLLSEELQFQTQSARYKTPFKFASLGANVINAAMDRLVFYRFETLRRHFPSLKARKEFVESDKYLGSVTIDLFAASPAPPLTQEQKLQIALSVLQRIAIDAKSNVAEYIGTKRFTAHKVSEVFKDKILKIAQDDSRAQTSDELDLAAKGWYAQNALFGTSEEKNFISFMDAVFEELKKTYTEIALLRNERSLAVYDFAEGRRFEPDFVLLLREPGKRKPISHQVFIEPKGNQFKDVDGLFTLSKEGWKQEFLLAIEAEAELELLFENQDFRLLGLPFYNKDLEQDFKEAFEKNLLLAT